MLEKFLLSFPPCRRRSPQLKRQSRRANDSGWRTYMMVLLAMMTGACQSTQQTPFSGTDGPLAGAEFCQAARAIYYSRHDTPPTIAQIKEHNAVGVALKCGWTTKAQLAQASASSGKGAK